LVGKEKWNLCRNGSDKSGDGLVGKSGDVLVGMDRCMVDLEWSGSDSEVVAVAVEGEEVHNSRHGVELVEEGVELEDNSQDYTAASTN
jgi:hypothetical protein